MFCWWFRVVAGIVVVITALAQPCDLRLENAYLGKEFWIVLVGPAFMSLGEDFAEIVVFAPYGGEVQLTVPGMDYWQAPVQLAAGQVYGSDSKQRGSRV